LIGVYNDLVGRLILASLLLLGAVGFQKNSLHLLAGSKAAKIELAAYILEPTWSGVPQAFKKLRQHEAGTQQPCYRMKMAANEATCGRRFSQIVQITPPTAISPLRNALLAQWKYCQ
jgi:hypothetical protein